MGMIGLCSYNIGFIGLYQVWVLRDQVGSLEVLFCGPLLPGREEVFLLSAGLWVWGQGLGV